MIVVGILAPASVAVVEIARRAAASGARTEIVGVALPGPVGDRQLGRLVRASVGHATVTRSVATAIEPADLELALRYLPDVRAIVLVAPAAPLLATASAASSWSGATLIVVGPLDADGTASLAATSIVLDPPARDPDAAFAGLVAVLAVRLDAGEDPAAAWAATRAALALDPA